jgi:hypothetical protein
VERKNHGIGSPPNIIEQPGGGTTTEHQATDKALMLTQNEETRPGDLRTEYTTKYKIDFFIDAQQKSIYSRRSPSSLPHLIVN